MKKKNKIIILIAIIIGIVIFGFSIILKFQQKKSETESLVTNETDQNEEIAIEELKDQFNAIADTNMYQIEEEYDGRQILQIKPSIQFETVLAGILKEEIQENEIQNVLKDRPNKNGIWIAKPSRDKFLKLLEDNDIQSYTINEDGYLQENREEENKEEVKRLNTAINSDKLYVIDISGTSYTRDEISGEIVEYPFEKMDPYQAIDAYEDNDSKILEITTNEKGKLSNQEILNEIIANIS